MRYSLLGAVAVSKKREAEVQEVAKVMRNVIIGNATVEHVPGRNAPLLARILPMLRSLPISIAVYIVGDVTRGENI